MFSIESVAVTMRSTWNFPFLFGEFVRSCGNILITPEGQAKVLDFGLAKAFEADPSAPVNPTLSPTLTSAGTVAGVILGTAAYMSPEQARGETVDKRADVWAFGCLLFEMLAGKGTFKERTVSDTLASVLKVEPDWDLLPADVPESIHRLLKRCIQKDARQRLHDIADARIEIEETLAAPHETGPARDAAATPAPRPRARLALTVVLVRLGVAAGLAVARAARRWAIRLHRVPAPRSRYGRIPGSSCPVHPWQSTSP